MQQQAAASHVIDVTEANFQAEVLQRSLSALVIVSFWSGRSPQSGALNSILEEHAKRAKGKWVLARVDIDKAPRIAQALRLSAVPNVKAIAQGSMLDEFPGPFTKAGVEKWLENLLGEPLPAEEIDRVKEGKRLIAAGELAAGIEHLNAHLAAHPGDPDASIALARMALEQGDRDAAKRLIAQIKTERTAQQKSDIHALEFLLSQDTAALDGDALRARIAADPKDYAARHDLAMWLAGRGDLEGALGELIEIVMRDREWEDDKARKTMVQLFEVMGVNEPATRAWQKRLGRAMY